MKTKHPNNQAVSIKAIFGKRGPGPVTILFFVFLALTGCFRTAVSNNEAQARQAYLNAAGNILAEETVGAGAEIDLVIPQGHYPAKAILVLRRPCYLRLEILSPIGLPDYFIVADSDNMRIFIPAQGKYYQGRPTAQNLYRFVSWPFNVEDAVMIFTGGFPALDDADTSYKMRKTESNAAIEAASARYGSQVIELTDGRLRQFVRKDQYGQQVYSVHYTYGDRQARLPVHIVIKMADGITSLSVRYNEAHVEKSDDLSIFNLPVPPGIKPVDLE